MSQPELFNQANTRSNAPATGCPYCGRPRMWRARLQEWSRYCGSQRCESSIRICLNCGEDFEPGIDGARVKYCSIKCMQDGQRFRVTTTAVTCAWCGTPANYRPQKPQGEYICGRCSEPLKHVRSRLDMHHVPADLRRQLVADPTCQICGTEVLTLTRDIAGRPRALLEIDHDHDCCPGSVSCGNCIRGFICGNCNRMLGLAQDSIETLEQAAAYLRTYRTKIILRDRERS